MPAETAGRHDRMPAATASCPLAAGRPINSVATHGTDGAPRRSDVLASVPRQTPAATRHRRRTPPRAHRRRLAGAPSARRTLGARGMFATCAPRPSRIAPPRWYSFVQRGGCRHPSICRALRAPAVAVRRSGVPSRHDRPEEAAHESSAMARHRSAPRSRRAWTGWVGRRSTRAWSPGSARRGSSTGCRSRSPARSRACSRSPTRWT